jgi:Ca2+-binding EF-hand superfamily protein
MGVNMNTEELVHLMEIFDTDGDGNIFWQEFVEW